MTVTLNSSALSTTTWKTENQSMVFNASSSPDDRMLNAMRKVEESHFRTVSDTGANPCAMVVWNSLRGHLGLDTITKKDLPWYNQPVGKYVKPRNSKLL